MKEIKLTKGKITIVDDDDFENLNKWKWQLGSNGKRAEIKKWNKNKKIYEHFLMHRLIMKLQKGDKRQVDHINGDSLDNRKENLRICTSTENNRNKFVVHAKSGYKGVYWDNLLDKWRVKIKGNNKQIHIGLFNNKEDAAKAYNDAAKRHHGKFARLNIIK